MKYSSPAMSCHRVSKSRKERERERGGGGEREGEKKKKTYIFPGNGSETLQKQPPITPEGIYEETLAREHGLRQSLRLVIVLDAHSRGQEGIRACLPFPLADVGMDAQGYDVAQERRRELHDALAAVYRLGELAAGEELHAGEGDSAAEVDRWGHRYH